MTVAEGENYPDTCVIVLNWRSPEATLRCVESVQSHVKKPIRFIVVDNCSGDGSAEKILAGLSNLFPQVVHTGAADIDGHMPTLTGLNWDVVLLEATSNGGYAAGNNLGLRLGTSLGFRYAWILNNDAYVQTDALAPLRFALEQQKAAGFAGSLIMKNAGEMECYGGGVCYPWLGRSRLSTSAAEVGHKHFYLMGASLLVRLDMLADVGLMDESYFMYFEETDWQWRARARGYRLVVAEKSVVYHGSGNGPRSMGYYYYLARAGVMFSARFSMRYPVIALCCVVATLSWQNKSNFPAIRNIVKGAVDGFFMPWSA